MIYLTKSKCNLLYGGFGSTNPIMSSKCKFQDGHPTMIKSIFYGGAMILTSMDGDDLPHPVNVDIVKRYYA